MIRIASTIQYLIAAFLGVYLGAGQHLAYTALTVTVSLVATYAARRSTRTAQAREESARGAESVQRVAVTGVVEDDLDWHVDLDIVGFTLDDVRHHTGTLV